MSLKVIHTKPDGSKVPIKVSIWEAFRGVPDPKPAKPKPVSMMRVKDSLSRRQTPSTVVRKTLTTFSARAVVNSTARLRIQTPDTRVTLRPR